MSSCCLKGFRWTAQPKGHETTLATNNCYVTGSNPDVAVMIIHDLYGWKFPNTRLLADHYADEVGATVYVPDFFANESLPLDLLNDKTQWSKLDLPSFMTRHSKATREPEILACAQPLRDKYKRTAAVGFCYGGWGVFRLGSRDRNRNRKLVDCISTAHPSLLEKDEIANVGMPVQILAPEIDPLFTAELKEYSNRVIPTLGVPYDYQFFPGLDHAFAVRGDPGKGNDNGNWGEREAMERAKDVVVGWLRYWLHRTTST